jgi:hypothetical protein
LLVLGEQILIYIIRLPFEIGVENTKSSPEGAGGRQYRVYTRFHYEKEREPGPGYFCRRDLLAAGGQFSYQKFTAGRPQFESKYPAVLGNLRKGVSPIPLATRTEATANQKNHSGIGSHRLN